MKKTIISTIMMILLTSLLTQAQDIIVKTDRSELKAKVLEVLPMDITYKRWDMQDGPTYTMSKKEVFMIIYQNGTRETFDESPVNSPVTAVEETTVQAATDNTVPKVAGLPEYQFTRAADRGIGNFGVMLNNIGQITIPTIHIGRDEFVGKKNTAISWGFQYSGNYVTVGEIESSTDIVSALLGGAYYFNELFKLDKRKAAVYAGGLLVYTYMQSGAFGVGIDHTTAEATDFSFMFRLGGSYRLGKRIGIYGDVLAGRGDPGFVLGFSIYNKQRN